MKGHGMGCIPMIGRSSMSFLAKAQDAAWLTRGPGLPFGGGKMGIRYDSATLAPDIALAPETTSHPRSAAARSPLLMRMSGYRPLHPGLYRAWNVTLALALIVVTLPLMAIITAALALTQGPRNVFYSGPRIGKDQRPFHIIKFKTLREEVAQLTRDRTLPPGSDMETLLGKPLRDTRLDELPQLFNVLRGDMNMLGPRPVRLSIAEKCRLSVPGYDTRFEVRPGLIGYTQALMAHSTDKAIRARVNARLCRRPVSLAQELLFIAVTGLSVLKWTGRVVRRTAAPLLPASLRAREADCGVVHFDVPDLVVDDLRIVHIDAGMLCVETRTPLPLAPGPQRLALRLRSPRRGHRRCRTARCVAILLSQHAHPLGADGEDTVYRCAMQYQPASPFQQYLIERYFIGCVLVG